MHKQRRQLKWRELLTRQLPGSGPVRQPSQLIFFHRPQSSAPGQQLALGCSTTSSQKGTAPASPCSDMVGRVGGLGPQRPPGVRPAAAPRLPPRAGAASLPLPCPPPHTRRRSGPARAAAPAAPSAGPQTAQTAAPCAAAARRPWHGTAGTGAGVTGDETLGAASLWGRREQCTFLEAPSFIRRAGQRSSGTGSDSHPATSSPPSCAGQGSGAAAPAAAATHQGQEGVAVASYAVAQPHPFPQQAALPQGVGRPAGSCQVAAGAAAQHLVSLDHGRNEASSSVAPLHQPAAIAGGGPRHARR